MFNELLGKTIKSINVSSEKDETPEGISHNYKLEFEDNDSFTRTLYKLSTITGRVIIKWYDSPNGYYAELVDFERMFNFKQTGERVGNELPTPKSSI